MDKDVRWRQRFSNYERAFRKLSEAVDLGTYNWVSQAGLIQLFELAFELAWKTMKDKLESDGFKVNSPRDTIKTAFQNGTIRDGELWMKALEERNLLTHTYDEEMSDKARDLIRDQYFKLLKDLYDYLKKESVR
ncbi:MAG: nucleotidyltransferase substrate binding protein [Candidatus Omnitrophica bacterium]|nr:nucleotidyltransferase substrate binding protein [Candidatus Omnitrophota bacterium]